MTMNYDDALRKVRSLLRLAASADANEAAAAAGRAQKLMDTFKIEQAMAELDTSESEPDEETIACADPLAEGIRQNWKKCLANGIATANGCKILNSSGRILLFGKPSDIMTVRYLYTFLVREIDRLCDLECKGCGRTYRNNYRMGAQSKVVERLKEQRAELERELRYKAGANETGLVRLNDALARRQVDLAQADAAMRRKYPHTRSVGVRFTSDREAQERGRRAGGRIGLSGKGGLGAGNRRLHS